MAIFNSYVKLPEGMPFSKLVMPLCQRSVLFLKTPFFDRKLPDSGGTGKTEEGE